MSIKGVMSRPGIRRAIGWLGVVMALLVVPWVGEVRTLLPSILAIVLVVVWRRAAGAIWVAAIFGLWVSVDYSLGDLLGAGWQAMADMLRPGGWRFHAVIFTLLMTVSAVFGGAVFGDHCSPVSDTTIVAAAACGVDPREHALTQLPYAMICAVVTFLLYWVAA